MRLFHSMGGMLDNSSWMSLSNDLMSIPAASCAETHLVSFQMHFITSSGYLSVESSGGTRNAFSINLIRVLHNVKGEWDYL